MIIAFSFKYFSLQGKSVSNEKDVIVRGQTLTFQKVRRHHQGAYTCAATNLEGRTVSNLFHLQVLCEFLHFSRRILL